MVKNFHDACYSIADTNQVSSSIIAILYQM